MGLSKKFFCESKKTAEYILHIVCLLSRPEGWSIICYFACHQGSLHSEPNVANFVDNERVCVLLAKCDADPGTPTGISVRACARMQSMLSASITDIIPCLHWAIPKPPLALHFRDGTPNERLNLRRWLIRTLFTSCWWWRGKVYTMVVNKP